MNNISTFRKFLENKSNTDIPFKIGSIIGISSRYGRTNTIYYELIKYVSSSVSKNKDKNGNTYDLYLFEAYPLKSNLKEVKGKKDVITLIDPSVNISSKKYFIVKEPDGTFVSDAEQQSEKRRENEKALEWVGKKPIYMMSKAEYKSQITPIIKKYLNFIKKYEKHFVYVNYTLNAKTESELDESDRFSKYKFMKGKYDEDSEKTQAPNNILKKKNELVQDIVDTGIDIEKLTTNDVNSNKKFIKQALDNGIYEDLIKNGKVNIKNVEEILTDAKLKVPKKLYDVESDIKDKGITMDVVDNYKNSMEKFIEEIKIEFKDVYDKKVDSYYNYYHGSLLKFEKFYKTLRGELTIDELKRKLNLYLTGKEPKVYEEVDRYGRKKQTIYYDGEVDVILESKVIKNMRLVKNWEESLKEEAISYVDDMFEMYANKLKSYFSQIDPKEFPKVEGVLGKYTQKGFDAQLNVTFSNGFTFFVETQTIWAGGYNIQVMHLRGLFKFYYKGKGITAENLSKIYNR